MIRPDESRPPPRHAGPGPLARAGGWMRQEPVAATILILCLVIEAVLEGADAGLWGNPAWREIAYAFGAFRGGLLTGTPPLYPFQPVLMFLSYSLLHGGFWHVTLNMLTLASLTRPVTVRLGQGRFLVFYLLCAIGGGAGFALFSFSPVPMIGASGALFGMAGAILGWAWSDRRRLGWSRAAAARVLTRPILYLVGFNVVFFFVTHGQLAWGAHLGGFLVGWPAGLAMDRRQR